MSRLHPHYQRQRSKAIATAMGFSLYVMLNLAAAIALAQGWAAGQTTQSHLCSANLPLMTNVTPDIRC